jgi:hypothetical protein
MSDRSEGVAIGDEGNCYVAGQFVNEVDLDPGPADNIHTSDWSGCIFLSKFDTDGNLVRAQSYGGSGLDGGHDVAVDDNGDVYLTGYFGDSVDFDPGPGSANLTSTGRADAFLAKYDSSGNYQWATSWGSGVNVRNDEGNSVVVDSSGNSYVSGMTWKKAPMASLGCGGGLRDAQNDAFLCKIDPNGSIAWKHVWGASGMDSVYDICLDSAENVYVTGFFSGSVDFDPGSGRTVKRSDGNIDAFLSKFNSNGDFQWVQTWGGREWGDGGKSIVVDNSGNIIVGGGFGGTVDFDPGRSVDNRVSQGDDVVDAFMCMYDSAGNYKWAYTWGGRWIR